MQVNSQVGVIEVGSIIVIHGELAIVEQIRPSAPKNPLVYKNKTDHRGYIGNPENVLAVLGKVDINDWNEACGKKEEAELGNPAYNGPLKGVKPGTKVKISGGGVSKVAIYTGYKPSRHKYPVSYTTLKGRRMKCGITTVREVQEDDGSWRKLDFAEVAKTAFPSLV